MIVNEGLFETALILLKNSANSYASGIIVPSGQKRTDQALFKIECWINLCRVALGASLACDKID